MASMCVSCDQCHVINTGLQLSIMGVDMNEFNRMMMLYIRELLLDVKPLVSHTHARAHTHTHTHARTHTHTHTL